MAKQFISPDNVHKPPTYSHVVKAGNTYYVAGQTALDVNGNLVGPGDVVAQAEQVYKNLRDVLEATGSGLKDVVKINTYLTDPASIPLIRGASEILYRSTAGGHTGGHLPAGSPRAPHRG